MEKKQSKALKGGEFLVRETEAKDIFIPGEFSEEQLMIAQTCQDFINRVVIPETDRIDSQEEGLLPSLLDQAGELGLLGVSVPEEYGGFGQDFITSMLSTEMIGASGTFAVAFATHTGIGTLPILYYGNNDQKKKYLPGLATGAIKGCYCLTEPNAGSDANAGRTKAVLSKDKKYYTLNGQKMWITNSGFADLFIVFAKIGDDKNLSAFIVEKGYKGIKLDAEEKKMGIKGSSTRQVFFNDCKVPAENLLGERDGGFKIAMYILNIGRIKLAAAALGAAKDIIGKSVSYANERVQFGQVISGFGAIKYKLAEQAVRAFACESALYRCSQNVDDAISSLINSGMDNEKATLEGIRQFATEAAIMKVFGSEILDYVVDEGVQIYGGMGYSAEMPMDRAYRDSRINRIFEGTNEINRLLVVDMLLRRALKGEIDIMGPAMAVGKELMSIPDLGDDSDELFYREKKYVRNLKKAILMVAGAAAQKFMQKLEHEQEIITNISDMIIQLYIAESNLLRVEKLVSIKGEDTCKIQLDMMKVFINDAVDRVNKAGKDAIYSFAEGDEQRIMLMGLKRFTKTTPFNIKEARRNIADKLIEENKYCF